MVRPDPEKCLRMQLRSGDSAVSYPGNVGQALTQVFTPPDDIARQNEDCMFLNVWTPKLGGSKKRPVMVWFHGGGFNYGSGSWPAYDGTTWQAVMMWWS
jgi:carboxylesterase type B